MKTVNFFGGDVDYFVDWEDFNQWLQLIYTRINDCKNIEFDIVLGINKSGIIPATFIAYKYNKKIEIIDKNDTNKIQKLFCEYDSLLIVEPYFDNLLLIKLTEIKNSFNNKNFYYITLLKPIGFNNPHLIYGKEIKNFSKLYFPWNREY